MAWGLCGNGGPLPALAVTRSDGVTAVVASATTSCEPAAAARLSFTPTADDVSGGPLQFSVSDASAGGYPIRVRLTETTMFCPRWSVNGYTALISLQNTTGCPVSGKVLLLDSSGVPLTTLLFSLLPGGAVQLAVPSGPARRVRLRDPDARRSSGSRHGRDLHGPAERRGRREFPLAVPGDSFRRLVRRTLKPSNLRGLGRRGRPFRRWGGRLPRAGGSRGPECRGR